MFFWKKKREIEFNYKWQLLQYALKNSFSNVKNDIEKIAHNHHSHENRFEEIFARLNKIEGILETVTNLSLTKEHNIALAQPIKQIPEKIHHLHPTEKDKSEIWKRAFDSLTETQKSFFIRLSVLLNESNTGWLPMKTVTQDLYPDKSYNDIKPMISLFVKNIEELGFIQKMRKGKQIFLTITDRGKSLFLDKTLKKLEEVDN
ncbi:hypothetical protein HY498_03295 [Candidatus Woesearchaeota archaeon]|nr:hypothetical protein [Candidatus Woesearchaeota archaeon]